MSGLDRLADVMRRDADLDAVERDKLLCDAAAEIERLRGLIADERIACADVAREHACQTWSECCNCGGEIAQSIITRPIVTY